MQKVTVVCLAEDRERTVERLGRLGIVHVDPVRPPSSDQLDALLDKRSRFEKACAVLDHEAKQMHPDRSVEEDAISGAPTQIADKILQLSGKRDEHKGRIAVLRKMLEQLQPWGSFTADSIEQLRAHGLHVYLCMAAEDHFPDLPDGCVKQVISRDGKMIYAAVICEEQPDVELPTVPIPEITDIDAIHHEIDALQEDSGRLTSMLQALIPSRTRLVKQLDALRDDITYVEAVDGMGAAERLAYLQGYVPESKIDALRQSARESGWGLRIEPADPDDPGVPTLLRLPRIFNIAKPVFDFVGILPGYNEIDVSVSVLIFLTIFFGMIVGDAGYGTLFLITGLSLRSRAKDEKQRLYLGLFILMSCVTILWGSLTGTWFAIPRRYLPSFMQGIDWLTEGPDSGRHIQWLCFLIAGIHLSLAHFWRGILYFGHRRALGQLGWALFLWGNFFLAVELIVYRGSFPVLAYGLYGIGFVLILSCGVNWRDVGSVMNLPFEFINSLVDVLSYIRLFAVGLSSYYIADSFNNMGTMLLSASIWWLPITILIILFGHALNIALAFMGVLVHGVRLNTLEFSSHMQLGWRGRPYTPLKRHTS